MPLKPCRVEVRRVPRLGATGDAWAVFVGGIEDREFGDTLDWGMAVAHADMLTSEYRKHGVEVRQIIEPDSVCMICGRSSRYSVCSQCCK
jgi:hypothetical protein